MEETDRMLSELAVRGHLEVSLEHGGMPYALWEHRAPKARMGTNKLVDHQKEGSQMNRLYILMTVMVVMVGAPLFTAHEALAELLTGTSGNDTLLGTNTDDRLKGRGGDDYLKGSGGDDYLNGGGGDDTIEGGGGNDEIVPGEGDDVVFAGAGNDLIYARDTDSVDYIDCGGGFDKVETIHRDDRTKSNCERALGPRQGEI